MRLKSLFALRFVPGLVAALCAVSEPLPGQSAAAFAHERDVPTGQRPGSSVMWWSGNTGVWIELNRTPAPLICVSDREGWSERIALELPGAQTVFVRSAAAGLDGAVAVAGYAEDADARWADFLVWISPDHKSRIVTQLTPYVPQVITLAGDGTIWTIGGIRTDNLDRSKAVGPEIRRFDRSGRLLSRSPVKGRARAEIAPASAHMSYIIASQDRIGWLTNGCEYLEFSLDGRELDRFDGPCGTRIDEVSGVALDAQNGLFLGKKGKIFELLTFDRSARAWKSGSMSTPKAPYARVLGFDGMTLITLEHAGSLRRYNRTTGSQLPAGEANPW